MEALKAFAAIVPYLTHPLALVGFVLLLVFGIHRSLIRSGVIPPVSPHVGGRLLQSLLRYGFVIALCVIVLGFLWRYLDFLTTRSGSKLSTVQSLPNKRRSCLRNGFVTKRPR